MKKYKLSELLNRFGMPVTLMVLGLILLVNPDSAAVVIAKILGWVLTAAGVGYGVAAVLTPYRRVSRLFWAAVSAILGGTLLAAPLLLAKNIGRFLGILLAIEGGDWLRKGSKITGVCLLAAAVGLIFAPMTLSRVVFSLCGVVVLVIGGLLFYARLKEQRYLNSGESNIIDAL